MFYDKNLSPPLLFNLFVTIAKITAIVQEQLVIIERLCIVQILSNLQFSTKVQKFGTPFLFRSLVRQIFSALRRKYKIFNLNNHWIGQSANSQQLFFFQYIVVSLVASWVSSPSINLGKFLI